MPDIILVLRAIPGNRSIIIFILHRRELWPREVSYLAQVHTGSE